MTIKKRLFLSNLLMILLPVVITGLIGLGCVGVVWHSLSHASTGFSSGEEFYEEVYQASLPLSARIEHALQNGESLDSLQDELTGQHLSLVVLCNGAETYRCGEAHTLDDTLVRAAETLDGEGMVFRGDYGLYAHPIVVDGADYQLYLFSQADADTGSHAGLILLCAALLLLLTIAGSILLTNRFLTRFVLQKIEQPLDLLVTGVHQLRDGNLNYRIQYAEPDEFASVCAAFNEMAGQLKAMVS